MVIILCGKSACGKDTIAPKLLCALNQKRNILGAYTQAISTTSRPMRDNETDGVEYHFVSEDDFLRKIACDDFLEYRSYKTLVQNISQVWFYGTEKSELEKSTNLILIKDLEGSKKIFDYCKQKHISVLCIYIDVPDDVRTKRAKNRPSFDEFEWDRRLKSDDVDFSNDKLNQIPHKTVQNEDVDATVAKIVDLVCSTPL